MSDTGALPAVAADVTEEDASASAGVDGPLLRDPPPPPGWEDPFEGSAVLHDLRSSSEHTAPSGDARPGAG